MGLATVQHAVRVRRRSRVQGLKRRLSIAVVSVVLISVSINALFPLYYMFITALKTRSEYLVNLWGWPHVPTLSNFSEVLLEHRFLTLMWNSAFITLVSVGVGTIMAGLAAYAFAKMTFRFKKELFTINVALISVPIIVMIVPLFVLATKARLINTYGSVVIIYVGMIIPATIYLLTRFFESIPSELLEAAAIDGCSRFKALRYILLPLSQPALMTAVIINSLWVWNDLLIALIFLQDESKRTLTVGAASFQGRFNIDVPLMMAALTMVTIPLLALYVVAQRYFIRGLVEGSLKQ